MFKSNSQKAPEYIAFNKIHNEFFFNKIDDNNFQKIFETIKDYINTYPSALGERFYYNLCKKLILGINISIKKGSLSILDKQESIKQLKKQIQKFIDTDLQSEKDLIQNAFCTIKEILLKYEIDLNKNSDKIIRDNVLDALLERKKEFLLNPILETEQNNKQNIL